MKTFHVYSNRHIPSQAKNINKDDWIYLENALSLYLWRFWFTDNGIDEDMLNITYVTHEEYSKMTKPQLDKFNIVGNPPYNDGSKGRTPIYDKFLEKLSKNQPNKVTFIIPTNWFTQPYNKLGKDVRRFLKELGLFKIRINPVDLFETATVSTCTVFCEKGYTGDILLENYSNNESFVIENFDQHILPIFDNISRQLINKLKPIVPFTTYSGQKGNTNKFRIVTSYMCYNILTEKPLNELKVIKPNYEKQSGYRVFAEFDTQEEANSALEYYNSFWHSKLVQFILKRTRTSTTLDNPQLVFVPKIELFNKKLTNQDLYSMFELSEIEIERVENDS
jgi:hypothetical protein